MSGGWDQREHGGYNVYGNVEPGGRPWGGDRYRQEGPRGYQGRERERDRARDSGRGRSPQRDQVRRRRRRRDATPRHATPRKGPPFHRATYRCLLFVLD